MLLRPRLGRGALSSRRLLLIRCCWRRGRLSDGPAAVGAEVRSFGDFDTAVGTGLAHRSPDLSVPVVRSSLFVAIFGISNTEALRVY